MSFSVHSSYSLVALRLSHLPICPSGVVFPVPTVPILGLTLPVLSSQWHPAGPGCLNMLAQLLPVLSHPVFQAQLNACFLHMPDTRSFDFPELPAAHDQDQQ